MAEDAADVERAEETGAMLVQSEPCPALDPGADARLAAHLGAGDRSALEQLVARHWGAAYHLALPLTGHDAAAAEDVAQDAFVRVLEQAGRFDGRRPFRPWLLRIVRNVALDQRRARERRARHEARAPGAAGAPGVDPAAAEERARVRALVAALPHDLRDALCVRYVSGLSLAEAAETLECPEGTVSSRVRRGLEALRRALGPAAASLVPDALGAVRELAVPAAPTGAALTAAADALRTAAAGAATGATGATTGATGATAGATGATVAKAAAATAPLRLALLGVPLLAFVVGGAALLLPDEAPRPAASAVAVVAPPASLSVVVPAALTVGDRAQVVLRGEGGAPTLRGVGGLVVGAPSREGDAWIVPVEARRAGPAELLAARPGADEVRATVQVRPRHVVARVVGNLELEGPEASAAVALEPRARLLRGPRAVRLRVVPGLAAEVDLSLRGFAREPTGCFEQTTAATYPSALVLELAQGPLGDTERPDAELVEHARACAVAGARRLLRFQEPNGSFSVYGDGACDPWITAVGLGELVHLARVVPVERSRIDRAADALLSWRAPDGRFQPGERTAPGREVAHTAYCAWALLVAGRPTPDVQPSLEWLEARVSSGVSSLSSYDLAHLARALLLDPTRARSAQAAVDALAARARAGVDPDQAPWGSPPTLTGSSAGAVETAALAAQVLLGTDHAALAEQALTWLARQRVDGGFGRRGERFDTQATVQALEAFRRGATSRCAARGQLVVGAGRVVEVAPPALQEVELVAPGADEAAVDGLLAAALALRWSGVGRVAVQLVVEGEVEADSPLLADADEARLVGLRVRVERPQAGQVGEPQRWRVQVTNEGRERLRAPMVELELPGGFELGEAGGGLPALREACLLPLFERRGDRLALYLRDLEAGERVELPLVVVPAVAGEFASGTLRAYPYYGPRAAVVVAQEPLTVAPGGGREVRYRPPTAGAARPAPAAPRPAPAAGSAAPAGEAEEVPAPVAGAAARHHRVAVEFVTSDRDDRLKRAPAELVQSPLRCATDPLAVLLASSLQGDVVAMSQVRRAGRWVELYLDRERAVDAAGRPITADMVAGSWAGVLRDLGTSPPRSSMAWEQLRLLVGMKVEVLGAWSLRVLPPEGIDDAQARLSAWPFRIGPFPAEAGSALLVSAGPYRLARCERDGLLLLRRAEKDRSPPSILLERLDPASKQRPDSTLLRVQPPASAVGLRIGAALRERLGDGLSQLRALFGDDEAAADEVRLQGTLRLAGSGPDERLDAVRRRLERAGAVVERVSGHGFDAEPDLYLGLLPTPEDERRGIVLERAAGKGPRGR